MKKHTLAGLMLGLMTVWGAAPSSAAPISVLADGGFESTSSQPLQLAWTSSDYGSWGLGDAFTIVTGAGPVSPLGGSNMLAFSSTFGASIDVYQIVDVSGYAAAIAGGGVTADFSAYFNAESVSQAGFGLRLLGFSSAPIDFTTPFQVLGGVVDGLVVDSNASAWQQFSFINVVIPTDIRYLALGLHEGAFEPIGYADNAALVLNIPTAVPEPATVLLFGSGLGMTLLRKLRRRRKQG